MLLRPLQTESLAVEFIYYSSGYKIPGETIGVKQGVHVHASLCLILGENVSTTVSRLGELAILSLIGRIVLTYVPLLFQSLDGLIGLAADENGPDDCPALSISAFISLKLGIHSNGFLQPIMGLRTDIGTVLIVCEIWGSSTALGVRVIVFAAECARNPSDYCSTRCFTGGFVWIGLFFLFERYNLGVPERSLGIPCHSVFVVSGI